MPPFGGSQKIMKKRKKENEGKEKRKNKFKDGARGPWFESWREPLFDPSLSEKKEDCPARVNCKKKKKKKSNLFKKRG